MDRGSLFSAAQERRRLVRRPSALPVTLRRLEDLAENGQQGLLWNISSHGLGLVVSRALEPGTALFVDLLDPARRFPFPTMQVIHATPLADGNWLLGGTFAQPLGGDALQAILLPHHSSDILLVEEEPPVREMLTYGLRLEGFRVWPAASGREAVDLYQQHGDAITLVLLDVGMEDMDGPQTLDALRALNPDLRCWFITGGAGRYSERELLQRKAERVLYKPFSLTVLVPELEKLVLRQPPLVS